MSRRIGAILAGGRARRFGSDKALATIDGVALIDHAAKALLRHVGTVVVVGREHPEMTGVPDRPDANLGPLGGIAGALRYADEIGADSVMTAACDVPFPPDALFAALERAPCWCEDHPVFGHWPVTLLPDLDRWLRETDQRSVRGFAREVGAIPVRIEAPIEDIDTLEDLERMR